MNIVRRILPATSTDCAAALLSSDASDQYRRRARALRGRWAKQPARLYRSLQHLSQEHDAQHPQPPARRSLLSSLPLVAPPAAVAAFADQVNDALCDGLLRHSVRKSLLRTADRLTIPHFEANLIMAALQHRHETRREEEHELRHLDRSSLPAWMVGIGIAGATQGLLMLLLYRLVG